jgi:16S rRNA (cytidine1402-2'-O)-methyltransferase
MILYLVPVPIGNLKDITVRAIEILKEVDFIIAEDSRYSLKLLNYLKIKKKIVTYFKPKEEEKSRHIIKKLINNRSAALITNAGTPSISDPGHILVKRAIEKGIEIVPLPGPTAFVPALVGSGIRPDRFLFLGFPPRKRSELKKFLKSLSTVEHTLIFYESPRRINGLITLAAEALGNRSYAVVKELSKKNEKIIRGNLNNIDGMLTKEMLLGELVLIIEGLNPKNKVSGKEDYSFNTLNDLFAYFKENYGISKNRLKQILMKKE